MAATTNYTGISYIEEVVEGEIPSNPAFQLLPTTGGSPVANITTAVSDVIRPDRQTDDLTIVDAEISGTINYELSYDPYKPMIKALLQNDTVRSNINVTSATAIGASDVISSVGIETIIQRGDVFTVISASEPTKVNGVYTCIDDTVADQITIYPSFPDSTAAATDLELNITEVIVNGADTPKSFTFKKVAVNNGVNSYWYYKGIKISTMNFNFATGSILAGDFSVIGLTETATNTPVPGESELPVQPYSIMNSVSSIGTIYLEGVALGKCSFEKLDLSYDNQITSAKSIGVLGACDTASYSVQITGSVDVFFQDLSLYQKFLNAESFGVTIILTDGDDNSIGLNMPNCKFESLDTPISGKDQFLNQSGSFRALRDATDNYMFKVSFIDKV